jgi:hypothetical protein
MFSFALLFNMYFYSIGFSEPDCDNCPLKDLCDENVLDCNLPFCEDEAYRKYFDPDTGKAKENALALISAVLNPGTLEAAVSAAATIEVSVETSGVSAVKNESSVETILKKDAVIN